MRVSHQWQVDRLVRHLETNMESISAWREKVATGKAYPTLSADPLRGSKALSLRSTLNASEAYLNSAQTADDWLTATEEALGHSETLTLKALELARKGATDTLDAESRQALAGEMEAVIAGAFEAANRSHVGRYLFAGYQVNTQPYEYLSGPPDQAVYHGDDGVIQQYVGPNYTLTLNVDARPEFEALTTALIATRDALQADNRPAVSAGIGQLDAALNSLNQTRTLTGARQAQLRALIEQQQSAQLALRGMRSDADDVILAAAISQLQGQENVYQATLEIGKRTLATASLFVFLS